MLLTDPRVSRVDMDFLTDVPRHLFFTGKGGVGKTTVACATAVHLARSGARVLLVSTDPASNIGQVFETRIGNTITPIPSVPGLSGLEIDPNQAAGAYRDKILAPLRGLLADKELASVTEQLSGSCTTEIASFNEFTSLLADPAETAEFDHVIFDTAPTGHTIRLLQLPGSWTSYLDGGKGDASCLGPMSGLEKNRATYGAAIKALTDPRVTRLVLVARAQASTLAEVSRTYDELAALGIRATHLVINAALPNDETTRRVQQDSLYQQMQQRQEQALTCLPPNLAGLHRDQIPLKAVAMVGVEALAHLFEPDSDQPAPAHEADAPKEFPELASLIDALDAQGHGLVMTMGKGGVGKTTVASAVAAALAQRGHRVRLTTTDPAAHLDTTLAQQVPGLSIDAIDPEEATQAYRDHVMNTKGASLDDAGRQALKEDLRSPCTEEIAVFQQFSQAVAEADNGFVVMDTAPTGHTILLMDATGSYHREVTRLSDDPENTVTPLMRLRDPSYTKILVVTLPETTPVLEATELASDLARADIHPWAWAVNNVLSAVKTDSTLLAARAASEAEQIHTVDRLAPRLAVIPAQGTDPVGLPALQSIAGRRPRPAAPSQVTIARETVQ